MGVNNLFFKIASIRAKYAPAIDHGRLSMYRLTLQKPHSTTYNKILNAKVGFFQTRTAFCSAYLEYLSTPTYRFRLIKILIKEKILQKVGKTFK